jgi:hypothetical protein
MVEDSGVDALLRQWAAERSEDAELQEVNRIKDAWLAEAPPSLPGIPAQRARGGSSRGLVQVESADPAYVAAMRRRAPEVPEVLLAAAASYWQLVGALARRPRSSARADDGAATPPSGKCGGVVRGEAAAATPRRRRLI